MAEKYGIRDYATPAGGCLLTDPVFSKRLKDLFVHSGGFPLRDVELSRREGISVWAPHEARRRKKPGGEPGDSGSRGDGGHLLRMRYFRVPSFF
jgi:hypothetical protein